MESNFINQNIVKKCNNILLQKININKYNNEQKKSIVQNLIQNMKNVYRKLDKSKINNKNFNKVLQVFAKLSVDDTIKQIHSLPLREAFSNSYVSRPISNNNFKKPPNNFEMRRQQNLNQMSRREIDFNKMGQNSNDIKMERPSYEQLLQSRRQEVPGYEDRKPETPKFSLDKKSNIKSYNQNNIDINENRMKGDTYYLSGNVSDSNFGSVNFTNNELSAGLPEIDESESVESRLKKLQFDRNNMNTSSTNNTLEKTSLNRSINTLIDNSRKDNVVNSNEYMELKENFDNLLEQYQNNISKQEEIKQKKYYQDINYQNQMDQYKQVQILQQQLQQQLTEGINKEKNIKRLLEQQKRKPEVQDEENDIIRSELISKVKILTGELEKYKKHISVLQNKNKEIQINVSNENNKKLQLIEEKKEEIKQQIEKLQKQHNTIDEKYLKLVNQEKKINKLIEDNSDILKSKSNIFLLDSKSFNYKSKGNLKFENKIENVKKIELVSYDFPLISSNVNNTNNKLYFKFNNNKDILKSVISDDSEDNGTNDDEEEINYLEIPNGTYDISHLIKKLNKLGRGDNLLFSYNKNTNKVTIKTPLQFNFTLFNKDNSILSYLGFTEQIYEDKNIYVSENSHDLRQNKYVNIYLTNIYNDKFAEVNITPSKQNTYTKIFDKPIFTLNHIDIEIKDSKNNLIDFCNLPFKLEFNIITINNDKQINNIFLEDNSSEDDNILSDDVINFTLEDSDNDKMIDNLQNKINNFSN